VHTRARQTSSRTRPLFDKVTLRAQLPASGFERFDPLSKFLHLGYGFASAGYGVCVLPLLFFEVANNLGC
jgi:hypothetical protein